MKKIKPFRILVFLLSVITLSKFFEADRLSILSLFAFIFLLFVLGYWVYVDEKEKNNLRVKFSLYEWLYKKLSVNVFAGSKAAEQFKSDKVGAAK